MNGSARRMTSAAAGRSRLKYSFSLFFPFFSIF